jgi:hypothetical protein
MALFLVVSIDEVGIILPALTLYYKFIRFPRLLTAFWTGGYHFRASYVVGGFKFMALTLGRSQVEGYQDLGNIFPRETRA